MSKLKILVVEDERETLNWIAERLSKLFDCDIDTAADGQAAVNKMLANDYNLVVLDIKLPQKNGIEVMREVKKAKKLPAILVVTAWDSSEIIYEVLQQGAAAHMPKPLDVVKFTEKVKEMLKAAFKN